MENENTQQQTQSAPTYDLVPMPDMKPETRTLSHALTESEIAELGTKLAQTIGEQNDAFARAKSYLTKASDSKKYADVLGKRAESIKETILAKKDYRPLKCLWHANIPAEGQMSLLHPETLNIIETRPIPGANEPLPENLSQTPEEEKPAAPQDCGY
ncbi:MAG: hypothetical protein E7037_02455 [Verrucomicrobia bacterium]|nr:hypothetical protein [Verrucomicrobiota bacterium]